MPRMSRQQPNNHRQHWSGHIEKGPGSLPALDTGRWTRRGAQPDSLGIDLPKRKVLHHRWLGRREREKHTDRALAARDIELAPQPVLSDHGTKPGTLSNFILEFLDLGAALGRRRIEK